MANKKLGTAASELKLPTKKAKGDKKPKWQAKTGKGRAKADEAVVAETTEQGIETPSPAVEGATPEIVQIETATGLETTQESSVQDIALEPAATVEQTAEQTADETAPPTDPEPTPTKPKKFKVKADIKPKKMSMTAAALQVLQERKVPMTCPEMIDVMATEGLWTSPGGKTPASTLYAAISRAIKDGGKAAAFRKTERGRFEAKIVPKE